MRDKIKEYFNEAIRLNPDIDAELRSALLRHERVDVFLNGMANEIDKAQKLRVRRGKKPFNLKTLKEVVYDISDIFVSSVKLEARKRHESVMAKIAREDEAQRKKDMDETLRGNPSGEFTDLVMGESDGSKEQE